MDRRRDNAACGHGSQRRKCPICELAEVEAKLGRVTAELELTRIRRNAAIRELSELGRRLGEVVADRNEIAWTLKKIVESLPANRDWLDPVVEQIAIDEARKG